MQRAPGSNTADVEPFSCTPVREIPGDADRRTPLEVVVETVADLEGRDPLRMPELAASVDPEVLNDFVTYGPRASPARLWFTYVGWAVVVRADGRIVVGRPADRESGAPAEDGRP